MSTISNDKLLKCITGLTSKVDNLSNIVIYQTKLIKELNTDNINLNNLIHSEFNLNKEIIQKLPIKQIINTLIKSIYIVINFINSKLNI